MVLPLCGSIRQPMGVQPMQSDDLWSNGREALQCSICGPLITQSRTVPECCLHACCRNVLLCGLCITSLDSEKVDPEHNATRPMVHPHTFFMKKWHHEASSMHAVASQLADPSSGPRIVPCVAPSLPDGQLLLWLRGGRSGGSDDHPGQHAAPHHFCVGTHHRSGLTHQLQPGQAL
jgi:hypothetical protein